MLSSRIPRAFALAFTLLLPAVSANTARADAFAGVMVGYGIPMGTSGDLDAGNVYGATLGFHPLPLISVAATYLHDSFETSVGGFDYKVDQYLAELNFFSMLWMNAGVHAGAVTSKFLGSSTTDLGMGLHIGFDIKLAEQFSIGAAGYWTYVTASDKYSTMNLMIPLKVWF